MDVFRCLLTLPQLLLAGCFRRWERTASWASASRTKQNRVLLTEAFKSFLSHFRKQPTSPSSLYWNGRPSCWAWPYNDQGGGTMCLRGFKMIVMTLWHVEGDESLRQRQQTTPNGHNGSFVLLMSFVACSTCLCFSLRVACEGGKGRPRGLRQEEAEASESFLSRFRKQPTALKSMQWNG